MTYNRLDEDYFTPEDRTAHALEHIAECLDDLRDEVCRGQR